MRVEASPVVVIDGMRERERGKLFIKQQNADFKISAIDSHGRLYALKQHLRN
jgi:hypothetical protein